jgi:hypothetical protein
MNCNGEPETWGLNTHTHVYIYDIYDIYIYDIQYHLINLINLINLIQFFMVNHIGICSTTVPYFFRMVNPHPGPYLRWHTSVTRLCKN